MSTQQAQLQTEHGYMPFGKVSVVMNKLIARGFTIISIRLGAIPGITVKPCEATRELDSRYRGYSFNGMQYFADYSALVDGVEVEWYKPRAKIKPWGEQ